MFTKGNKQHTIHSQNFALHVFIEETKQIPYCELILCRKENPYLHVTRSQKVIRSLREPIDFTDIDEWLDTYCTSSVEKTTLWQDLKEFFA